MNKQCNNTVEGWEFKPIALNYPVISSADGICTGKLSYSEALGSCGDLMFYICTRAVKKLLFNRKNI